jgi:hypothetical protein
MVQQTFRITRFDQGMSADLRSPSGVGRVQHFKVYPHRLVPQFNTKADEDKSLSIAKFMYAPWLTGYALFGYGVKLNTSLPGIFLKGTTTGNIITDTWGTPVGNVSSGGSRDTRAFFHYKNYLYGFHAGNEIWRYGDLTAPGGVNPSFNDAYQAIAYTNVAQPVHHPSDDCAYFFIDNKVYRLNNTTWDGLVLTLPDNLVITSGTDLGDYLAIGCKSKTGFGNSTVFLWDRDSSLSTVSAKIDWGSGDLIHLANLEGILVGVTDFFTQSQASHSQGKVIIKQASTGQAKTVAEFVTDGSSYFDGNKIVIDDKLHFALEFYRNGAMMHGIWSVDARGNVAIEISEAEADAIGDGVRYQGIYKTGNFWWLAHSADGSVNRTDDQSNYTYTSILETDIIGTPDVQSSFIGATVAFEPLPSGASVTLKYRKVGDTSWTTLKAQSTAGESTLSIVSDGTGLVPTFNEIQFRAESTGGAIITGLEGTIERNDKKPYGRG